MKAHSGHLSSKPSVITGRAKLHRSVQQEGQTISASVAEWKGHAQYCKFSANLCAVLRDCFVCGLLRVDFQKCPFVLYEPLTLKSGIKKEIYSLRQPQDTQRNSSILPRHSYCRKCPLQQRSSRCALAIGVAPIITGIHYVNSMILCGISA